MALFNNDAFAEPDWLAELQHTVGGVVAEIAATMQTLPQYDYEVILVNDCSPDDTFGTIRSLCLLYTSRCV